MAPSRILLIDQFTGNGFNSLTVAKMSEAFRTLGYDTTIWSLDSEDAAETLQKLHRDRASFLFMFSCGRGHRVHEGLVHELFGIPHFTVFADHPLYKFTFVDFTLDGMIYGFSDPGHVRFCRSFFGGNRYVHFPQVSLLPCRTALCAAEFTKREKALFFSGTAAIMGREWSVDLDHAQDMQALRKLREWGLPIDAFLDAMVRDSTSPLDFALRAFLQQHQANLRARISKEDFARLFMDFDVLIRARKRQTILRALAGLPLCVMGDGWDKVEDLGARTKFLPRADYLACEAERTKYQMSLHIGQGQPEGGHDRLLHASAIGQAILSERTPYTTERFPSGNTVLFDPSGESVHERYEELLIDEARRYEMARAGLEYMRQGLHSPKNAAERVLWHLRERALI